QVITVAYEQVRGMREKHQTAKGYQVSASKTINLPLAMLYGSWADDHLRCRWRPSADLTIRSAAANKTLRITWEAAKGAAATSLEVNFYSAPIPPRKLPHLIPRPRPPRHDWLIAQVATDVRRQFAHALVASLALLR